MAALFEPEESTPSVPARKLGAASYGRAQLAEAALPFNLAEESHKQMDLELDNELAR